MGLNPGRLAAARALLSSLEGGHVEDYLDEQDHLRPDDFRLAWNLALGVLRKRGQLDHLISKHSSKPLDKQNEKVLTSLRIGCYELRYCRTPNHAAIHEAVELCKRMRSKNASGFVNAVLRKCMNDTLPESPELDVPNWLYKRMNGSKSWLSKINEEPVVNVVSVDMNPLEFANVPSKSSGEAVEGVYRSTLKGSPRTWPGFHDGQWWIMDPSAAKVVDLGWEALGRPKQFWALDACAAPGGKTFRLLQRGAGVLSVDSSRKRLSTLSANAKRLGCQVDYQVHDWSQPLPEVGEFDLVLVDAPCTGSGVIRRHPEIRWRRQESDAMAMAISQRQILKHAMSHVKPGGVLVYAVCSFLEEEGPQIKRHIPWPIVQEWRSFPPKDDEDAFYAIVARRNND